MVVFCYVYSIMLCLFWHSILCDSLHYQAPRISKKIRQTGGGSEDRETLSAVEERILGIIGSCVVEGNSCYGVLFCFAASTEAE